VTTFHGPPGPDVIIGTNGPDVIFGFGGDDIGYGAAGDDTINGVSGNDQLFGGSGDDVLHGGGGTISCVAMPAMTLSTATTQRPTSPQVPPTSVTAARGPISKRRTMPAKPWSTFRNGPLGHRQAKAD
jgi:RTX calcium-binding nonapeptide repeat (4 copies)